MSALSKVEQDDPCPSLDSLPGSVVCFTILAFLSPQDVLSLRASSKRILELFHNNNDPKENEVWKVLLERHFSFDVASSSIYEVLNVASGCTINSCSMSIFGVDPRQNSNHLLIKTSDAFLAWKHWVKASYMFYESKDRYVHAPFFVRAAKFWKSIFDWCNRTDQSGEIGARIKQSLGRNGWRYNDWVPTQYAGAENPSQETDPPLKEEPGVQACQAVYAFCGGQHVNALANINDAFSGLLGGYQAYGYYSCCHLICSILSRSNSLTRVFVGTCPLSRSQGMMKGFAVDPKTGQVQFIFGRPAEFINVLNRSDQEPGEQLLTLPDDFLTWLEEYAHRLQTGTYGVGLMGSTPNDPKAITLYPRVPASAPINNDTQEIPYASRAVTRGVELVASAVFVPQGANQFGFIYSIRIRLLTPEENDYVTEAERGFATCQLESRHWRITNNATGHTEHVNGEGVIGMYPLLKEGGYVEDDEEYIGIFQYQSCTGRMESGGSFAGHLHFVPGSLRARSGPGFNVQLEPFRLDPTPEYLY